MGHAEYIKDLDEGQLARLVEVAQERISEIRDQGWVGLWLVSTDGGNLAYFASDDYSRAVSFMAAAGAQMAADGNPEPLQLEEIKRRPDEAKQCLLWSVGQMRALSRKSGDHQDLSSQPRRDLILVSEAIGIGSIEGGTPPSSGCNRVT